MELRSPQVLNQQLQLRNTVSLQAELALQGLCADMLPILNLAFALSRALNAEDGMDLPVDDGAVSVQLHCAAYHFNLWITSVSCITSLLCHVSGSGLSDVVVCLSYFISDSGNYSQLCFGFQH